MKALALLTLTAGLVGAQTNQVHFDILRTLDGESFTNATITSTTAAYAIVMFDGGGKRVAFTNLAANIQQAFGFDPVRAQSEIALENRRRQESQQRQAVGMNAAMRAQQESARDRLFRRVDDRLVPISEFTNNMRVVVAQVLTNGILGRFKTFEWDRTSTGDDPFYTYTVFIRCPTRGIVEGQQWQGFCCRDGTYTYRAVFGRDATVAKFDTGLSYFEVLPKNPTSG
jgi:hypothetical protein